MCASAARARKAILAESSGNRQALPPLTAMGNRLAIAIATGVAAGSVIAVSSDNIAVGAGVGAVFAIAMYAGFKWRR